MLVIVVCPAGCGRQDINSAGQTDVTYYEYKEMSFNSIRTSFAADDLKQRLLKELTARFERFELR